MNGLRGLTMNGLRAKYPTKVETTNEFINGTVGSSKLKTYPFYTTEKLDLKGMAFTVAYKEAIRSTDNKEVCTCVCSMLNDVSSEFQNSVTTALVDIGVQPGTARLPACAYDTWDSILQEHINNSPQLDWPTILVYFGCCILTIFKKFTNEENYNTFMINSIRELRERAKCDPDVKLDIPFDFKKANAIKTMLGACSILRKDVISFLFKYMNCENSGIGSVCHYLENVLAWIDMRHLVLVNDFLIMPQSRVLHDLRVSREVENLNVAIAKVTSYPYPQFFMCMVSNLERFTVEPSMFPTLIAVAQELERADNNNNVANFESISITGTNATMIRSLVKLHQTTFPQKSSRTSNVQMLPIKHENPQNLSRTSNVQRLPMKQENPQKRSRASNVQMPPVKQENPQNRSRTSNVQMLPMKQKNPQKRSRTSNVQMPPVKQENPQNRSRTSNDQMPPMKQKNPQKRSRNSNVQMPPVKQEKSSLGRMVQVVILD